MDNFEITPKHWICYTDAVRILKISSHANQLKKRMEKYPSHFIDANGIVFMSAELFNSLSRYKAALQVLTTLQTQGGKKCTLK
jgi:hypothetical protein